METKYFKVDKKRMKLEKGEGSSVIATLNVKDKDGDVTLPGAFGEQHVNVIAAHNYSMPRLGKGVIKEQDDLAIAEFKFNLDKDAPLAREWYSSLKFDLENGEPLQEWSYGYNVIDSLPGDFNGEPVRFLKSLDVIETSPVVKGSGVGTGTLAMKETPAVFSGKQAAGARTFKEEMELATTSLADVRSLIGRAQSLADLRVKDGRDISDANRDSLKSLSDSLAELQKECEAVIRHSEKDKKAIEAVFLAYQKNRVLLGV